MKLIHVVQSAHSCTSKPISLHIFFVNLFSYSVSICNIYEVKLLSNSVKWSMRPFPREGEGVNYK